MTWVWSHDPERRLEPPSPASASLFSPLGWLEWGELTDEEPWWRTGRAKWRAVCLGPLTGQTLPSDALSKECYLRGDGIIAHGREAAHAHCAREITDEPGITGQVPHRECQPGCRRQVQELTGTGGVSFIEVRFEQSLGNEGVSQVLLWVVRGVEGTSLFLSNPQILFPQLNCKLRGRHWNQDKSCHRATFGRRTTSYCN